jgi:Alkylmercury lyase
MAAAPIESKKIRVRSQWTSRMLPQMFVRTGDGGGRFLDIRVFELVSMACPEGGRVLDASLLLPLNATDDPLSAAVRARLFGLLLHIGRPVTAAELGTPGDTTHDEVRGAIDALVVAGRVTMVEDQVTGSLGLSVTATRHRLDLPHGTRHTWCALDAVGIFGALGVSGRISSTTPDGESVVLELADGIPLGSATVAVLLPPRMSGPTVRCWCPLVNFFTSVDRATAWSGANDVPGEVLTLPVVAEVGTRLWRDALDAADRLGPWTTGELAARRYQVT